MHSLIRTHIMENNQYDIQILMQIDDFYSIMYNNKTSEENNCLVVEKEQLITYKFNSLVWRFE